MMGFSDVGKQECSAQSMGPGLAVLVFSHDRGDSLAVCLESIARSIPGVTVIVVDDDSTDAGTVHVLDAWKHQVTILEPDRYMAMSQRSRGRLHANMQRAFEFAQGKGVELALVLQDDMQMVRTVGTADIQGVLRYFHANPDTLQLLTTFSPFNREEAEELWAVDESGVALFPKPRNRRAYSAVGLFHLPRFFKHMRTLEATEQENVDKADALGLTKGTEARYPFMMFLPYPETAKSRNRTVARRITERMAGSGVHPFEPMTGETLGRFLSHEPHAPPLAREWLRCPSVDDYSLWSYYGGARDLRARGGWRGAVGTLARARAPQVRRN